VARAEALLATQFVRIVKENTEQVLVRAGDYSLPTHIDDCSIIYGLHGYPVPKQLQKVANNSTTGYNSTGYNFGDPINPTVIKDQYRVTEMNRSKGVNIPKKATVNLEGQNPSALDLKTFFQKYVTDAQPGEDRWTKVVGDPVGPTVSATDGEAEMDIQYIKGVAPGVEAEVWNYQAADFCQDLKSLTTAILNATDAEVPRVFSLSYGWQGKIKDIGCTDAKIKDIEQDFQKVALRGITLIVGSGDSGAGYNGELDRAMDGHLYTAWPGSSPWVTAVGATEFTKDGTGTEQAVTSFGSGGGFSRYPGSDTRVDAPWQENAVQAYLKHLDALPGGKLPSRQLLGGNTDGPFWTTTGRATPDVAVLGSPEFQIVANGEDSLGGGTSASAPTFAGLVSLLNAARAQHGAPPMGFMNPFVYQHPEAFTDIVLGDNSRCDWGAKPTFGFKATKGWDPVTGMGVPNFPKLMEAALAVAPQVDELA